MRVITGSARGARLKTLEGNDTRPTTDKVKGAIFNILGNDVFDKTVLDLYAGSGALGIEALSRGAGAATFVEKSAAAVQIITQNLEHTKLAEKARIVKDDVISALGNMKEKYDVIFLDPPYAMNLAVQTIQAIEKGGILAEDGVIIAETDEGQMPDGNIGNMELYDKRKYGRININFYKKI